MLLVTPASGRLFAPPSRALLPIPLHWALVPYLQPDVTFPALPASNVAMSKKLNKCGRLVPTRPTGIEYQVRHAILVVGEERQHGKGMRPTRWVKCVLQPEHVQRIPEGSYFLHSDDGKIHQLRSIGGEWHYLAVAA